MRKTKSKLSSPNCPKQGQGELEIMRVDYQVLFSKKSLNLFYDFLSKLIFDVLPNLK